MSTYTRSSTQTFTASHAKYLAGKVIADLQRCRQIYGSPTASSIANYETELVEQLKGGYVSAYEFGFEIEDTRVVSWRYTVQYGDLVGGSDDRPGKIYRKADITGASFFNYLTTNQAWSSLSQGEKDSFESALPFKRATGPGKKDGNGQWVAEKSYSTTGCAVSRLAFIPYS